MANDDRQFKIRITTEADLSGTRAQSDALKDVGKSGTDAHASISAATEKTEISHRALRVILRNLGPEFAEVGHEALFAFANPTTLALVGITAAIGLAIKSFTSLQEHAIAAGKAADASLSGLQDLFKNITTEITASDEKFAVWFHNLDHHTGVIEKRFEEILKQIKGLPNADALAEQAIQSGLNQLGQALPGAKDAATSAHATANDPAFLARVGSMPGRIEEQQKRVAELKEKSSRLLISPDEEEEYYAELQKAEKQLKHMNEQQKGLAEELRRRQIVEEQATKTVNDYQQQIQSLTGKLSPGAALSGQSRLIQNIITGEESVSRGGTMDVGQRGAVAIARERFVNQAGHTEAEFNAFLKTIQDTMVSIEQRIKIANKLIAQPRPS